MHYCDACVGLMLLAVKTHVKSVNSNWSVSISLLLVKSSCSVCGLFVGFVYVIN